MKVLHISNWFPTSGKPYAAQWIKDHVRALETQGVQHEVIHFEVQKSNRFSWKRRKEAFGNTSILINVPFFSWKLVELVHFVFLIWILVIKKRQGDYDLVNFHIAYPQLVHWSRLKRFIKKPVAITEHWSAYHFHFNLPADSRHLNPIRHIFRYKIPVISVSNSLLQDIKSFSKSDFPSYVVPNVVDHQLFKQTESIRQNQFFMVSLWAYPKNPMLVLRAFKQFSISYPEFQLRVGGYGEQEGEIKQSIEENELQDKVVWLGSISKDAIAREMNKAKAFIHCSDYETFSVVCAEAVTCGCPVIASRVGGIPEVVPAEGNYLIDNDAGSFLSAMKTCVEINGRPKPTDAFALEQVGKTYKQILETIILEN